MLHKNINGRLLSVVMILTLTLLAIGCNPDSPTLPPQPTQTQIILSGGDDPKSTRDFSVITETPIQPTDDAVVIIDEGTENEAPNEVFSLSTAEIANSGTHKYTASCISASGNMDECQCETAGGEVGRGELSFDFSDGAIEFGDNATDNPTYEWIEKK